MYTNLVEFCGKITGYFCGLVALGVATDVILRAMGLAGIPWMFDFIEYTLFGLTMVGATYVMHIGKHVKVDLLTASLPRSASYAVNLLATAISFLICFVFLIFSLSATYGSYAENAMIYKTFEMKAWIPLSLVPFMFGMLSISLALKFLDLAKNSKRELSADDGEKITVRTDAL